MQVTEEGTVDICTYLMKRWIVGLALVTTMVLGMSGAHAEIFSCRMGRGPLACFPLWRWLREYMLHRKRRRHDFGKINSFDFHTDHRWFVGKADKSKVAVTALEPVGVA